MAERRLRTALSPRDAWARALSNCGFRGGVAGMYRYVREWSFVDWRRLVAGRGLSEASFSGLCLRALACGL